jgi:FkbM family methyltransferase
MVADFKRTEYAVNVKSPTSINAYLLFDLLGLIATPNYVLTHKATLSDAIPNEEFEWRKATNKILIDFFFEILTKEKVDFFLELGAFDGSISKKVSALGIDKITAVEANTYTFEYFKKDFEKTNINYINYAVSNSLQDSILKLPKSEYENKLPNSSLLTRTEGSDFQTISVPSIKLSQLLESLNSNDYSRGALWIDLEGFAYEILQEALDHLDKVFMIFVELEDFQYWTNQKRAVEVFALLEKVNFFPLARDWEGRGQYNVIFVRSDENIFSNSTAFEYMQKMISLKYSLEHKLNTKSENQRFLNFAIRFKKKFIFLTTSLINYKKD